ncbi:hypothetical protein FVEN_g1335 [Fusarium venenatum]|uniref:Uncharacterized protein n=2 Tax=Fusarium sambucinum species complex TaxID=569360 RepID=A0A2L2TF58_9HYPO|nr:uncharacterized protein FVRRES_12873 [Fusarium venenatum]XP_044703490.1 hypothetical protein FPOAC1_011810 [Fusarium poae]KAG8361116.1 hypothetical protein FVEN_g1335 [Fusarium venenatum]KAG8666988.1 hypothetical protein FPOAC1_011810 [Fusarium poae]KAH6979449.1 hypothetical protein EDB82DRAFT_559153 [Fusarium venenatum]OBS19230.1 hypothetical protein FPOA_10954 [Fusarium poae]CEI40182.1 unnamed protein product [Fusarium venenatum]
MSAPTSTASPPPTSDLPFANLPSSPAPGRNSTTALSKPAYASDSDSDGQARGGRRSQKQQFVVPLPTSTGLSQPAGQLLKGATDENGNQKSAALLVGIKLDLEAEVHLTARVKGDICIGLY